VELAAGQSITAEMRSSTFDTYLSLMRGPGDQLIDNDDISSEDTNSRFSYTAQAAGTYFIAATAYLPNATGAYTLRVVEARSSDVGAGEADASGTPLKGSRSVMDAAVEAIGDAAE
jgi:hypothetical protein